MFSPARDTSTDRATWYSRDAIVVLGIYALTRLLSAGFLLHAGARQEGTAQFVSPDPWNYYVFRPLPADPGYLGIATNWDGQWYQRIATLGYLPANSDGGGFAERAWAFPPAYPMTVKALSALPGLSVPMSAVLVSTICGAIAALLLFRLTRERLGSWGSFALVAIVGCYITAPLYQVAYAEAMAMCFLLWTLLELCRHHYARAFIPLILLAFTRLIAPPLAVVAVVHLWARRRSADPPTRRETVLLVTFTITAACSTLFWPRIAAWLDGSADADRVTSLVAGAHLGWFDILWSVNPWTVLVPIALSIWFARIALSERNRLGPELSTWAGAYPVFILAVTAPTPGFFRYFMMAFPLAVGGVGAVDSPVRRRAVGVAIVCAVTLALQYLWVRYSFVIDPDPSRPVLNP